MLSGAIFTRLLLISLNGCKTIFPESGCGNRNNGAEYSTLSHCNCFILVVLTVDPEPILGTLGARQEVHPACNTSLSQGTTDKQSHLRTISPISRSFEVGVYLRTWRKPMTWELWGSHATRCATAPPASIGKFFIHPNKKKSFPALQSWPWSPSSGFVLASSVAPVTHNKVPHVAFKPKQILGLGLKR